jgi:hypothetical protein
MKILPNSPLLTATQALICNLVFDIVRAGDSENPHFHFERVDKGSPSGTWEIAPQMHTFQMTPDGVWRFKDDDGDEETCQFILPEEDASDVQDRITADLRNAFVRGGMKEVKYLLRLAVAGFACPPVESVEDGIPEPDEAILQELSEAILTPCFQQ